MSRSRVVLAFLVAPLMTPLFFAVYSYAQGTVQLFTLWGLFAYGATALFGIPAYFIYRALGWSHVALFILGGAVIGFVVSLFIMESIPLAYFIQRLGERFWFAFAGALSALVFRMILWDLKFNKSQVPING